VLRLLRDLHQDDEHVRARTKASSRGDSEAPERRTPSGCVGAAPATLTQRRGARKQKQSTPASLLPRGGTAGDLDGN
jgi:hypothetical protein